MKLLIVRNTQIVRNTLIVCNILHEEKRKGIINGIGSRESLYQ